jgi:putative nucleotidyltransferase with HDIG domain
MPTQARARAQSPAAIERHPASATLAIASGDLDLVELDRLDASGRRAAEYLLRSVAAYPTLPAAVAEVMAIANCTEANFRDVDRVIRQDPVVAARVLSVANSPLYRPPQPLTSLRAALLRLGWGILREVLLQAVAEAHLFRVGPRRELAAARLHAVVLAHVHRHVASVLGFDSEHAFACGLLHDLGRPIALALLSRPDAPPLDALTRGRVVSLVHGELGARVAEQWNLPSVVARVCRDHHAVHDPSTTGSSASGVSTIAICEVLVSSLELASEPLPPSETHDAEFARLGLPSHELESLRSTVGVLCREAC